MIDSTVILSLDMEKAFDRVESQYLLSLLDQMAFGSKFIIGLQAVYRETKQVSELMELSETFFQWQEEHTSGAPFLPYFLYWW